MNRKIIIVIAAVCLLTAIAGCGSKQNAAVNNSAAQTVKTDAPKSSSSLPEYKYSGDTDYLNEICIFILNEQSMNYDKTDVKIPVPVIYFVDNANQNDIKVWGDFCIDGFDLDGNKLVFKNGGVYNGVIHLKKTGNGYEITEYKFAEDGEKWSSSLMEICEGRSDLYDKYVSSTDLIHETERQIISDYVNSNGLNITSYEVGADNTPIINAPAK